MLGQSHRPDEHGVRPVHESRAKRADPIPRGAALASRSRQAARESASRVADNPIVLERTNASSTPSASRRAFSTPTRNARSPPVCTSNQWSASRVPNEGALRHRGHPVPRQSGLAVRVHDRDLGSVLFRVVQVLRRHRLVVGGVGAEEDDEVGAEPVHVAAGGCAVAERRLHRRRRGRVAQPGRVVHVVRAEESRRLLRGVVDLVGDAARREVERRRDRAAPRGAVRRNASSASSQETTRKPGSPATAQHRMRQPAQLAQSGGRAALQRLRRRSRPTGIERGRRVQPHQLEPDHAEVRAPRASSRAGRRCRGRSRRTRRRAGCARRTAAGRGFPTRCGACPESDAASARPGRRTRDTQCRNMEDASDLDALRVGVDVEASRRARSRQRDAVPTRQIDGQRRGRRDRGEQRDAGGEGLLHDFKRRPATHEEHVRRQRQRAVEQLRPMTLSTALWRPTSSAISISEPSSVNSPAACSPPVRSNTVCCRRNCSGRLDTIEGETVHVAAIGAARVSRASTVCRPQTPQAEVAVTWRRVASRASSRPTPRPAR